MKTFVTVLIAMTLTVLTWASLGWVAFLVIPSIALFALMTFTPLLTDWAQRQESADAVSVMEKHSAPANLC